MTQNQEISYSQSVVNVPYKIFLKIIKTQYNLNSRVKSSIPFTILNQMVDLPDLIEYTDIFVNFAVI